MTEPMLIYIAGPYRADSSAGKSRNICLAQTAALRVWGTGNYALCPHVNSAFFDEILPNIPDAQFLLGGIAMLAGCDAILMLDDWEYSEGAKHELEYARTSSRKMKIYYNVEDIPRATKGG